MSTYNPYYVLQQYFVDYCIGGNDYRIVLCKTNSQRERMIQRSETPEPGWIAVHMTKTADEMRDYCEGRLPDEMIADETGEVLMGERIWNERGRRH